MPAVTMLRSMRCSPFIRATKATNMLGTVLAEAGDADAAWTCYEHVTRHRLTTPAASATPYAAARSERRIRPDLHAKARLKLHLALGRVADDLGDPARAMRQFHLAGRIRFGDDNDCRAIEVRVERLIDRFGVQQLAGAADIGLVQPSNDHW